MVDIITVFSITGGIITIGFLGNLLFRKTGFPDILFLLLIGIILGPLLQVFPRETLLPIIPYLTTLALMIILFDSGLNMNLYKVLSRSLRSTILAILYISFVTIGISLVAHFLLGLGWLESLMLSPMLAGTSSIVIIPLVSKLKMNGQIGVTLSLESTITDVLNVILLLTILEVFFTGYLNLQDTLSSIAAEFAVGIVFGFIVGVVWIKVLFSIRREEYTYILTLAMLLFSYTVAQMLGGNGALAALIFGLVLGNDKDIIRILRMRISASSLNRVKSFLKRFHREISFLIRAIFFVFLGLIYDITGIPIVTGIIYGITFTAIDLILRHVAVYIATLHSSMSSYRNLMTFMCGQGLANATLSIIVYQKLVEAGITYAFIYPVIVVNVIIMTNIVTSISSMSAKCK
ncbi:MAG: cation:proton antiporter, partial [Methanosarcinales archaeon]